MSGRVAIALFWTALVASALSAAPAAAQEPSAGDKETAKRHFDTGLALLRVENYSGAAIEFEASARAFPTRNAVFNLANCYQALGRYGDALDAFARLRTDFEGELPKEMREAVARHEEEIRGMTGTVAIRADRDGAAVLVDGVALGILPLPRPLVLGPGTYSIELRLEGFVPERRQVTVVSRSAAEEAFTLVPARATLTVDVDVAGATVAVDGETAGVTPLPRPLDLAPGRHTIRVEAEGFAEAERAVELEAGERTTTAIRMTSLAREEGTAPGPRPPAEAERRPSAAFWIGFGLTVAAGGVAGGAWIAADHRYGDWQATDAEISSCDCAADSAEGEALEAERDGAQADATRTSRLAIGFGIGAGVAAVTAAIVLALDLKPESEEGTVSVSAAPGGVSVEF